MKDLTTGNIRQGIWSMAIPLITASFVQMAYNMTDMIWLGHLGSECVAAVGVAGFFTWLCNSLSFIGKIGAEVTISQSLGSGHRQRARVYANQAALLSAGIALIYAFFIFFAAPGLAAFFRLEPHIADMSVEYLRLVAPGIFFTFNNNTFSGLYNGQGDSKTPLKIVATGLAFNIVLDPLLIYGPGPLPALGTAGAAIATAFSQLVVYAIFVYKLYIRRPALGRLRFLTLPRRTFLRRIAQLGIPVSAQSGLFSMFSMALGSMASTWGHIGVAVQSIGAQIEAITWMTAAGFSTALASFVGQNYGARNYERIRQGYAYTMKLALAISGTATVIFIFFGRELFSIFVNDSATRDAGADYMLILALSQIFVCIESVTTGAFNGCGRTVPPALVGITLTGARLPMAYALMSIPALGLNGIWLSITLSSILKGIILGGWYHSFRQRLESGIDRSVRKGLYRPGKILGRMYAVASRLWQQ